MNNHIFAIRLELDIKRLFAINNNVTDCVLLNADLIENNLFEAVLVSLVKNGVDIENISQIIKKYKNNANINDLYNDYVQMMNIKN